MTQITIDTIAPPPSLLENDSLENNAEFMGLLSKLYEADAAMEQWKTHRDDLRQRIAAFVANAHHGVYVGKTVRIDDSWKFTLTVTNGLNVKKSHARYKELPAKLGDRINQICYTENKSSLVWRKEMITQVLTPDEQAYFAEVLDQSPTFAFKFTQKTDDR